MDGLIDPVLDALGGPFAAGASSSSAPAPGISPGPPQRARRGRGRRLRHRHGRGRASELSGGPVPAGGRGSPPAPDGGFDLAANGFGLWHLADPAAALREAGRVLRPGRLAFTTWLPPDQGFDLFGIVLGAIRQHGTLDVPLPPAPPPFRFADPAEAGRALGPLASRLSRTSGGLCLWRTRAAPTSRPDLQEPGTRADADRASAAGRKELEADIDARAETFRSGDLIELRFPYLLVTATKA